MILRRCLHTPMVGLSLRRSETVGRNIGDHDRFNADDGRVHKYRSAG